MSAVSRKRLPDEAAPPPGKRTSKASRLTLAEATRREREARAKLAELEYRKRSGLLIPTAEAEATYSAQIIRARTKLLAIPSQLKRRRPHLTPEDLADLDALIREALTELATAAEDVA
ncbi:MAG TPA: hypothetical protein VF406_16135 [Thermodesulfobacteriota bacterium]